MALLFPCLFLFLGAVAGAQPAPADSGAVSYQASRIEDDVRAEQVLLTGDVILRYGDVELRAGRIRFDRKAQSLEAEALPDSTGKKTIGRPVLIREGERLSGDWMAYDLQTGRGRVRGGRAEYLDKYYQGENILLRRQNELDARHLSISTCDRDHVHYDFLCEAVKVLENDKAIGRSVTFRIGPVPVFWVPFFVFPTTQQGRQSGLLTPSVGSNSRDGIFVRNLGYYFAPSEYWDTALSATLRERGGFLVDSRTVYAVRNRLSGSVDLSFERVSLPGGGARNWRVNLQHQQRLSPTLNIRGNGQFSSNSQFDLRNSDDLYTYLNRQLRSSFSLDKRWNESGRSLDASLTYYRDLENDRNTFQGFPRLSVRQGRRRLFGGGETGAPSGRAWYEMIYYNVSGDLTHDFTRNPDPDDNRENLSLRSALSLNTQQNPFGWLDLTPSLSVNQAFSHNDQELPTRTESYIAGVSTSTTLYGIFHPDLGRLKGIRHRLQPRLNFSYNQTARVDGGTFGFGGRRTWGDPGRSLDMGLSNTFEVKTGVDGAERRSTFATLNFSTAYGFDRVGDKWSPLRTLASIKPDRRVDVRLNMTHALYDDGGRFSLLNPRLRNLSVSSSFRFSGGAAGPSQPIRVAPVYGTGSDFGFEGDLYTDSETASSPWRVNLSHYYELQKLSTLSQTRSWVKLDFGFSPTARWRLDYGINYDLIARKITAQNAGVYRDLHCWEARFSWYSGFNSGFYFKINIKEIPQIKFEHRQGGFGL